MSQRISEFCLQKYHSINTFYSVQTYLEFSASSGIFFKKEIVDNLQIFGNLLSNAEICYSKQKLLEKYGKYSRWPQENLPKIVI